MGDLPNICSTTPAWTWSFVSPRWLWQIEMSNLAGHVAFVRLCCTLFHVSWEQHIDNASPSLKEVVCAYVQSVGKYRVLTECNCVWLRILLQRIAHYSCLWQPAFFHVLLVSIFLVKKDIHCEEMRRNTRKFLKSNFFTFCLACWSAFFSENHMISLYPRRSSCGLFVNFPPWVSELVPSPRINEAGYMIIWLVVWNIFYFSIYWE